MVLRFRVKRYSEFVSKDKLEKIPYNKRGIYALLKKRHITKKHADKRYDVIYIGMSRSDIKKRLRKHRTSKRKGDLWNYFSIFEADSKTTDRAIEDMEGILRQIYRRDSKANRLNTQRKYKKIRGRLIGIDEWK